MPQASFAHNITIICALLQMRLFYGAFLTRVRFFWRSQNGLCAIELCSSFPSPKTPNLSVCVLLVRSAGVFRSLELHFETLHTNLEAVHRLYGSGGGGWIVVGDETWNVSSSANWTERYCTKTFALIRRAVNENFRWDYSAKGHKHLHELCIAELLR